MSIATARFVVENLAISRGSRRVCDSVNFTLEPGEVLAVLGPNGAGKTSLLEGLAGLVPTDAGSVTYDSEQLSTFKHRARLLSFMPDEITLPTEMSVGLALGIDVASLHVDQFDVRSLLSRRGDTLSRGEAKRCLLCASLVPERPVVLLDEPFGAFDPRQLKTILSSFRAAVRECVVIATVHQMRTAELCADKLLLLSAGKVIALGSPAELRARTDLHTAPFDDVFLALLDGAEVS